MRVAALAEKLAERLILMVSYGLLLANPKCARRSNLVDGALF
jgi:hypothetical protein